MATSLQIGTKDFPTLADLSERSLEERSAILVQSCGPVLSNEIEALQRRSSNILNLSVERVAWAFAYNIRPPVSDSAEVSTAPKSYLKYFPPETPWAAIWSEFTKEKNVREPQSTLLRDFMLSVASEQCQSLQPPGSALIDTETASRTFEFVYGSNRTKVVGALWSKFGARFGDPVVNADEAWARVFCNYWSINARERFLGLSRIWSFVFQVARNITIDQVRDSLRFSSSQLTAEDLSESDSVIKDFVLESNLDDRIAVQQLKKKIEKCMEQLAARQRLVAHMVWFRGLTARETAKALKITEPAVSQHVSKARHNVRMCLETHGIRVTGQGSSLVQ
jgi:RNA polymerase sigma factor (sigma-70 family)